MWEFRRELTLRSADRTGSNRAKFVRRHEPSRVSGAIIKRSVVHVVATRQLRTAKPNAGGPHPTRQALTRLAGFVRRRDDVAQRLDPLKL